VATPPPPPPPILDANNLAVSLDSLGGYIQQLAALSQAPQQVNLQALGWGPDSPLQGTNLPTTIPVPSTPTNLSAHALYQQVALTWEYQPSPALQGWEIQRNGQTVGLAYTNSFLDTGLADSTSYTYYVRAVTLDGQVSSWSSSAAAVTLSSASSTVLTNLQTAVKKMQTATLQDATITPAKLDRAYQAAGSYQPAGSYATWPPSLTGYSGGSYYAVPGAAFGMTATHNLGRIPLQFVVLSCSPESSGVSYRISSVSTTATTILVTHAGITDTTVTFTLYGW
jgi:hypothetical protein